MIKFRLNGWLRLGVTITALWFLYCGSQLYYEYRECSQTYSSLLGTSPRGKPFLHIKDPTSPIYYRWEKDRWDGDQYFLGYFSLNFRSTITKFFVPVLSAWGILVSGIFVVKWINAGFRKPSQEFTSPEVVLHKQGERASVNFGVTLRSIAVGLVLYSLWTFSTGVFVLLARDFSSFGDMGIFKGGQGDVGQLTNWRRTLQGLRGQITVFSFRSWTEGCQSGKGGCGLARQLRIQYPGAFYHVPTRGNQRQAIFKSHRDQEKFLEYLESATLRYGARVHVCQT